METKTSFDTVRISSHGEFINEPLYDELIKVPRTDTDVKFNIYFRGGIGSTVLTRCNTRDTQLINGKQLCSSFIGRRDFSKNMEITLNSGGISNSIVMGCDTPMVPDMLLTFNDDFVSGFALYKEDGSPLYCNGNYVSLDKFKKDGVEQSEIKLREVLNIIYDELQVKGGEIDIYVSSCLYINPDILNDIKTNFASWFECNRQNIIIGYEKEFKDNAKTIETLRIDVTDLNTRISDLNKPKPVNKNTKFFLQMLNNEVEDGGDLNDYVYLFIKYSEVDPNIQPFDELITDYMNKNIIVINEGEYYTEEQYREISNNVVKGLKEQLENTHIDISEVDKYNRDLVKKTDEQLLVEYNNSKILKAIDSSQKRKIDNYGDLGSRLKNTKQKRGGKKKNLTYKLNCLEKCKCKRQRIKMKNMKYDMKQFKKNNKCHDKCHKKCFKKTMKKMRGGGIEDLEDNEDGYDEFIRQLATHDDKYSLKSCLELKNYTDANRRSMLDPIVKKHIKKCSKAIVIKNFFNFLQSEYDLYPPRKKAEMWTNVKEIVKSNIDNYDGDSELLLNSNMAYVIMESDYYNYPIEIREQILNTFTESITQEPEYRDYSYASTQIAAQLSLFIDMKRYRIIFMSMIQDLQNRLREIDIDEDTIDEVIIKFVKSLYWNKKILL